MHSNFPSRAVSDKGAHTCALRYSTRKAKQCHRIVHFKVVYFMLHELHLNFMKVRKGGKKAKQLFKNLHYSYTVLLCSFYNHSLKSLQNSSPRFIARIKKAHCNLLTDVCTNM